VHRSDVLKYPFFPELILFGGADTQGILCCARRKNGADSLFARITRRRQREELVMLKHKSVERATPDIVLASGRTPRIGMNERSGSMGTRKVVGAHVGGEFGR
jgi:hypothetical protein